MIVSSTNYDGVVLCSFDACTIGGLRLRDANGEWFLDGWVIEVDGHWREVGRYNDFTAAVGAFTSAKNELLAKVSPVKR